MKHTPTFRPWVLIVDSEDGEPMVLGYKREREAIAALMEMLGIDDDEELEAFHTGTGWYDQGGGVKLAIQQISYPVE